MEKATRHGPSRGFLGASALALVGAAGAASAQVDVTGITSALSDGQTAVAAIGAAMVLFAGAGIAYKWVLGFLFK